MDTANRPKTKLKPTRPDSLRRHTVAGRWPAALGALLLAAVCVFCARWGFADLIAQDAIVRQSALSERAARTGAPADARVARAIGEELLLAQRFDPGSPAIAEQLGSLYALNVREGDAGIGLGAQRGKALEQYSKAAAMRPTSPYSWANLAWTKYYLGLADAEFYRALDNAIRLGPWEPEVQIVAVDLGFAMWNDLPAAMRPKVMAMAQNGQRRQAEKIIAIARKHGRLMDVCKFEKLAKMAACMPASG